MIEVAIELRELRRGVIERLSVQRGRAAETLKNAPDADLDLLVRVMDLVFRQTCKFSSRHQGREDPGKAAEAERQQAYERARRTAGEEAKATAAEEARKSAEDAARKAAEEAYKQAYDKAYQLTYEAAYKQALLRALQA